LPLEFQSHEAMGTQVVPQALFGLGLVNTQVFGFIENFPLPRPLSRLRERGVRLRS
jgi:hypothetical protein